MTYKIGQIVCCCDCKHREIKSIEYNDTAVMADGGMYDLFHCVEPVQPDNSCHDWAVSENE